jgi:hypothetical protein
MGNVDAHKIKIDKLTHIIKSKPTTPKPQNEVTHTGLFSQQLRILDMRI